MKVSLETVTLFLRDVQRRGSPSSYNVTGEAHAGQQCFCACEVFWRTQRDAQFHIRVGSGENVSLHVWDTEVGV